MIRASQLIIGALTAFCLWLPSTVFAVSSIRETSTQRGEVSATPATSDLRLRVPSGLRMGAPMTTMDQIGSLPVSVGVSRLDNGQVRVGPNLWNGKGLRFPAFSPSNNPPRAVIRVAHTAKSGDPFAPESKDFAFAIYFKKDATSSGTKVDDGDNLMQRGLYADPAQYKMQVDGGKVSCVIKGDQGRVTVKSDHVVNPSLWYYAKCTKRGTEIILTVKEYRADGTTYSVTKRKNGATGSLVWDRRETPISLGGKLTTDGRVVRSTTDQFNGWATHPWLEIKR